MAIAGMKISEPSVLVFGVDPGSRFTGYGLLRVSSSQIIHIEHGVISAKSENHPSRLVEIGQKLKEILTRVRPQVAVIEKAFLGKNADSAFKLGQARGVCLYECGLSGSKVVEYASRSVRLGVTGSGAATKDHSRQVVLSMLRIESQQRMDAADALALAFHHGIQIQVQSRIRKQTDVFIS